VFRSICLTISVLINNVIGIVYTPEAIPLSSRWSPSSCSYTLTAVGNNNNNNNNDRFFAFGIYTTEGNIKILMRQRFSVAVQLARHGVYSGHSRTRTCHVAQYQKPRYSRCNFVAVSHSCATCYLICTSGSRPPSVMSHSPRQTAVFRSVQFNCLTREHRKCSLNGVAIMYAS